jgi:LPS-assembly protein
MQRIVSFTLLSICMLASVGSHAFAQAGQRSVNETTLSRTRFYDRQANYYRFEGDVELETGDTKIYADGVEFWVNENRLVAKGNVVFTQGNNRVAADRAEFDVRTRLGTFYNASGIANMQPPRQTASAGGIVAPQMSGVETDVYFFGEQVEKIGPKKYKITNGGFSTCVQPTPRWNLSADTIVLNIDHYTLLRDAVLKVKGVPLLYLPVLYYPTKEDGRATGFLIPTYSQTRLLGQSIQVPFFWAINRSHDATVAYEWFSKAARGFNTQYRYNLGLGSDGNFRGRVLDQQATSYSLSDGTNQPQPATRSYDLRGNLNQPLPLNLRGRARVDYFSSVTTMQQYNTNIYDASRSQRSFGGNVTGAWRTYSLNATVDRSESFYNLTDSVVNGGLPRVAFSRNERPLFGGMYFSANSEYVQMIRQSRNAEDTIDSGLARFDFTPQVRFPFKRWQWFTVNSSVNWRETYYSRSQLPGTADPRTGSPLIVGDNLNRQYFTMSAQTVGPVFNRVWDTPGNGYAERFKHSVEPFFNVTRVSTIDNFDRIVLTDGVDRVVGNSTNLTYGINNRVYAKRRAGAGGSSQAQEIVNISLAQTYYTQADSARYDAQYASSLGGQPSNFSPLTLAVRVTPTRELEGRLNAEFDSKYRELRNLSAGGSYNWTNRVQTSASWSQKYFIAELPGWNDPLYLDHYLIMSVNAHTRDNRFGGLYSFNYNILRSSLLQQRLTGFYNAQCCGIAFDYQVYNFNYSGSLVPADHRFFISFTLAGLGNFSPFNGAMAGVPR